MLRTILAAACLALAFAGAARADEDIDERITNYASDITVERDGTVAVRETITFNVQGYQIRHGIYRDFPTLYQDGVHADFTVSRVLLDGRPEPYELGSLDNGVRILIGDPDSEVSHGLHTYEIDYATDREIAFHPKFDELYWNVTGNGWHFLIDRTSATVHLPPNADIIQYAFYTGMQGERGKDAAAQKIDAHTIRFDTTARLFPEHGLTIAVGFSEGAVVPPSPSDLFRYWVRDHQEIAAFAVGFGILLAYYGLAWLIAGRDPSGGTLIPLFSPPDNLSPASVRYLLSMSYDSKMFASDIVDMAARGFLKISEKDGVYTLTATGKSADDAGLTEDERETERQLFAHKKDVALVRDPDMTVARAVGSLTLWLQAKYDKGYLVRNRGWFWPGMVVALLTIAAVVLYADDPGGAVMILLFGTMTLGALLIFGFFCYSSWKSVLTRDGTGSLFLAILLLLPVAGFGGMFVALVFFTFPTVPAETILFYIAPVAVVIRFHYLLARPTPEGARLTTAIRGFKLFLTTASIDKMEKLEPPDVTPELFEKFMPYAMALDCENEWSKKFEAQAARAGLSAEQVRAYQPDWYSGASFAAAGGVSAFATSFGSSLSSATISASSSPSSSSGSSGSSFSSSSGGGFSGGGGGGGGGGGW